jgi:hypothetical protein
MALWYHMILIYPLFCVVNTREWEIMVRKTSALPGFPLWCFRILNWTNKLWRGEFAVVVLPYSFIINASAMPARGPAWS